MEEFEDFAAHKNSAIERAQGDWVLLVDADERMTPALAAEIQATLARDPDEWGFWIETSASSSASACATGRWSRTTCGWSAASTPSGAGAIHEHCRVPPERVGRCDEGMWHFSHRSIEEMLVKTVRFGEVQSRELLRERRAAGDRPGRWRRHAGARVRLADGPRRGYKDGMPGIIESIYQPFSLFCVHVMLWQRQRRETLWETYQGLERQAAEHR